jgi:hypothetical protein
MKKEFNHYKFQRNIVLMLLIASTCMMLYFFIEYKEVSRSFELYQYEKWNMTEKRYNKNIVGLYVGDYALIWMKGRSYEDALETFNHEWQHHRYRSDWEHFVEDGGLIQYER